MSAKHLCWVVISEYEVLTLYANALLVIWLSNLIVWLWGLVEFEVWPKTQEVSSSLNTLILSIVTNEDYFQGLGDVQSISRIWPVEFSMPASGSKLQCRTHSLKGKCSSPRDYLLRKPCNSNTASKSIPKCPNNIVLIQLLHNFRKNGDGDGRWKHDNGVQFSNGKSEMNRSSKNISKYIKDPKGVGRYHR